MLVVDVVVPVALETDARGDRAKRAWLANVSLTVVLVVLSAALEKDGWRWKREHRGAKEEAWAAIWRSREGASLDDAGRLGNIFLNRAALDCLSDCGPMEQGVSTEPLIVGRGYLVVSYHLPRR